MKHEMFILAVKSIWLCSVYFDNLHFQHLQKKLRHAKSANDNKISGVIYYLERIASGEFVKTECVKNTFINPAFIYSINKSYVH